MDKFTVFLDRLTDGTVVGLATDRVDIRDGATVPSAKHIGLSMRRIIVHTAAAGLKLVLGIHAFPCLDVALSVGYAIDRAT